MLEIRKIRKANINGTLCVSLPKIIENKLKIKDGDSIIFKIIKNKITLEKVNDRL